MKGKYNFSATVIRLGRFSYLLVAIILTFALRPFLEALFRINLLSDIFLSVILLSAMHTVIEKRCTFFIALALALPCLMAKWLHYLVDNPLLWDVSEIFGALFTAYLLVTIIAFVARQQEVTAETIMAAVCGYFVIGFMWGFIYLFMESVQPGSFKMAQLDIGDQNSFLYFSFVTMTTVGYGDMLPVSNAARSLAMLEAVMGQLYLAVTIARLVGAYISQHQEKR